MRKRRTIGAVALVILGAHMLSAADADPSRINSAVEALTRLESASIDEKPQIRAAVERVLEKTRGTPNFVRLVRHFKLTNQNSGLIEVAVNHPDTDTGVDAMRLVLAAKDTKSLIGAIKNTNSTHAAKAVLVLGNAREKQTVAWLEPIVAAENDPLEVRRAAVRALAQTQEGASALLSLARADKIADSLKFVASSELNAARWPEIKSEAAKVLPLPAAQNAQPLPPVADLARMKGNGMRGAEVYRRETTGCIKCHQVGTEGTDVGPALTEIGTKLAREALFEAILDPSAGISFGYEAWQVELASGDEAYGIKASETADEVAIKDTNGIVTRHKKSAIKSMQQSKTSIMPAGLQQTLTPQDLVDLVEYLSSLKKEAR